MTPSATATSAKEDFRNTDSSPSTYNERPDELLQQLQRFESKLSTKTSLKAEFRALRESMQRTMKENEDLLKLAESQHIEIGLLKKESARKDEEIASLKMLIRPPAKVKEIKEDDKRSDAGPMKLRKVRLHRKDGRLGMGFRGTAIDRVQEGGPAALQGIQRGDQLISVNGVNVEGMSHQDIGALVEGGKERNERVKLVVRHNPERLKDVEEEWSE